MTRNSKRWGSIGCLLLFAAAYTNSSGVRGGVLEDVATLKKQVAVLQGLAVRAVAGEAVTKGGVHSASTDNSIRVTVDVVVNENCGPVVLRLLPFDSMVGDAFDRPSVNPQTNRSAEIHSTLTDGSNRIAVNFYREDGDGTRTHLGATNLTEEGKHDGMWFPPSVLCTVDLNPVPGRQTYGVELVPEGDVVLNLVRTCLVAMGGLTEVPADKK